MKSRVGITAITCLAVAQRQHVDQRPALRGPRALGQLVDLEPVDLAAVGEEEQEVVGRADVQVLDVVALLHVHPHHADAAAVLLAVGDQRQALDVAGVGDRDHHLLVGDHVLDVHVALEVGDLGAALVAVALVDLVELVDDQRVDPARVAEDRAQLGDPLDQLGVLGADLVGLERGEPRRGACRGSPAPGSRRARTSRSGPRGRRRCRRSARISSITASRLSSAISRPSRMWARASARRSSYWVRRVTTSRWWPT